MKTSFLFSLFICIHLISFSQEKLSVYFDFNSSVLKKSDVQKIYELIQTTKVEVINIVAFTDTFGTTKYNQILAKKRLNEVLKQFSPENLKNSNSKVLGENYLEKDEVVNNYKTWRRVDVFYTRRLFNEPQVSFIEGIIVPEEQIVVYPVKSEELLEESELLEKSSEDKFNDLLASESPKIVALDVKFYGGVDEMIPTSLPDLQSFYKFLKDNPSVNILIRGHVCCMDDYNLSVKRAKAVYNYLIDKGIDKSRLSYKGFSNSVPVVYPEYSEADMSKNRRVDVEIVK